jgi:uncharacterized membrane protein YphA (DoxX/SURF4 family)
MKGFTGLHHPWVIHLSRLFLALVFIAAAMGKILDVPSFTKALDAYRLLPEWLLAPLGYFLPWLEFMIGLALLIRRWPGGAALLATGMMVLFILVLAVTMLRGIDIDCGCFAIISEDSLGQTLVRDLVFLLPCLILLTSHFRPASQKGDPA